MGKKSKGSRKGKKAWRANISTEDIDDFIEKSTKDALSGGSLSNVPADSLFFVDKSKDLSVRRKIEKHREKVLRCDSVLQRNPFVQAVPSSNQKEKKKSKQKLRASELKDAKGLPSDGGSSMVDLWGRNDVEPDNKIRKVSVPSVIPAVEVEAPGYSYNPPSDAHQDSLAKAVAEEMQKIYQSELGPQPVPLTLPAEHQVLDEDMYFLEADNGDEDENNLTENEDTALERKSAKPKRVTRVELNKRARQKEQKKMLAESKKKEELSKEIDSYLPDIMNEIAKEDKEKQKRHVRRMVAKQERLKTRPPRLGKHKYEPAPSQVLLSEEITGSLRKLKGCCTLLKDRFKSLVKRGLISPAKSSSGIDELEQRLAALRNP